jgi:long-chain acyl-CoA synthetase
MEQIWLKQYPAGVPADIDVTTTRRWLSFLKKALRSLPIARPSSAWTSRSAIATSTRCHSALGAYLQSKGLQRARASR